MKHFLIALQILTNIPVTVPDRISSEDFGKSLAYFPIVGLMIGISLYCLSLGNRIIPYPVLLMIIITAEILITAGLHLDGLADTCDGFYGVKEPLARIKIMRDSSLGTMGVLGIVLNLLFRFAILLSLPQDMIGYSLIVMSVCGRWAQVFCCFSSPPASKEGTGLVFIKSAGKKEILGATLFALAICFIFFQVLGILLFAFIVFFCSIFRFICIKKIGGMTGDTIGATNEIAEIVTLFSILIFLVP